MPIFIAGEGDRLNAGSDEYSPGDLNAIDKAIRHMDAVVAHERVKGLELVAATGSDNFDIVVQNDPETQRARVYGAPINGEGIHEELSQALLLRAALGMEGS